ncbi:methyltransferase domain-containing protein [Gammaproteobacteria bacterium]|jgi:SAM-dependent methyltransferase|nr:methyltransferase domain-containing protein [Gammaproteobacteria bacterium]
MQSENYNEYSGLEELLHSEAMPNYNHFIVKTAKNAFGEPNQLIDFGAGIGTLSLIFREKYNINPLCVEIDKKNQEYLSQRKFQFFENLTSAPNNSDAIFSSNVLEHIEDDVSILKIMRDQLKNGGRLYLYLPAKMLLWSKLDEVVGHYRRYEISELRDKCEEAGFKIIKIHYADSAGFFASLLMKFLGYNPNNGIGSVESMKFYDKYLFPVSSFLDRLGFRYLLGKNIVLIAEK